MSCSTTNTLSNTTFIDVCIVANAQNNPPVLAALQTCCGSNLHTIDNGCYTYCNVTTPGDTFQWDFCISDNLDPILWADLDFACPTYDNIFDYAVSITSSGTVTSTFPNNVPTGLFTSTTWSPTVTATLTFSASGKAVDTFTFDPKATNVLPIPPLGLGFQLQHLEESGSRPVAASTGFLTEGVSGPSSGGVVSSTPSQVGSATSSSEGAVKTSGARRVSHASVKKLGVGLVVVLLFGLFV